MCDLDCQYKKLLENEAKEAEERYRENANSLVLPTTPVRCLGQGSRKELDSQIRQFSCGSKCKSSPKKAPEPILLHPFEFTKLISSINLNNLVTNNLKDFNLYIKGLMNRLFPKLEYRNLSQFTSEQRNILKNIVLKLYRAGEDSDR